LARNREKKETIVWDNDENSVGNPQGSFAKLLLSLLANSLQLPTKSDLFFLLIMSVFGLL
jgi:hypothetical protein